jgi:hypothetical protein
MNKCYAATEVPSTCFYFSRLTADEEESFRIAGPNLFDQIRQTASEIPETVDLLQRYQEVMQVDLFDAIQSYEAPQEVMRNRMIHLGFCVATAFFVERVIGRTAKCVGFYSSGVQPALVYSGSVSIHEFFDCVLPFVRGVRRALVEAGQRHRLAACLLVSDHRDDNVEGFVTQVIAERGLAKRVFFKDRRHQYSTLIAGFREEVSLVRSAILQAFPSISPKSARLHDADGAHMPLYPEGEMRDALDRIVLRPPRFPLVGTAGQVLPAGCRDQDAMRLLLWDAVSGPMDTGAAMRAIAARGCELLAIGSEFGAKVLRGTEIDGCPRVVVVDDLPRFCESRTSATYTSATNRSNLEGEIG